MKSRGICSRLARSSTEYSCATSAASPWSSTVVRRSTSVLILPSLIAIVLRTWADTSGSCVTTRIVTPSSVLAVRIAPNTWSALSLSSSPVGSSASSTAGWLASAMPIATRCCSPPDIWAGILSAQYATPTRSSSSIARERRLPRRSPASRIGRATFSVAVRCEKRFLAVCCHRKPTTERR